MVPRGKPRLQDTSTFHNTPTHPERLQFTHPNNEVVFPPPDILLLWPTDQEEIALLKNYYSHYAFPISLIPWSSTRHLRWHSAGKNYSIADCISKIRIHWWVEAIDV
jgi:hypothetical protein